MDYWNNTGTQVFVRLIGCPNANRYDNELKNIDKLSKKGYILINTLEFPKPNELKDLLPQIDDFYNNSTPCKLTILEHRKSLTGAPNSNTEKFIEVHILYWYNRYLKNARPRQKLIIGGLSGETEYLFGYFAYRLGYDVLLLMPDGEIINNRHLLSRSQRIEYTVESSSISHDQSKGFLSELDDETIDSLNSWIGPDSLQFKFKNHQKEDSSNICVESYRFNCPKCAETILIPYNAKGITSVRCSSCGKSINVDTSLLYLMYVDAERAFELGKESFKIGSYKKAFRHFKNAAECNHAEALFYLYNMYYDGFGVDEDKDLALSCLRLSVALGNSTAYNELGVYYWDHDDLESAKEILKKGADLGNKDAMYNLGLLLDEQGFTSEAIYWLKKAYEKGDIYACNSLGLIYEDMEDYKTALNYFVMAANGGAASGQFNLGRYYRDGKKIDSSVPDADPQKAFEYFQMSARQNNAQAMCILSSFYRKGYIVEKNEKLSLIWLKRAADLEEPLSQFELGEYYYRSNNIEEAHYWIKKSCDNGNSLALKYYPTMFGRPYNG